MKKRILCSLLCLLLMSMAACGTKSDETMPPETVPVTTAPPETTEETTIPAPTEPEWEHGVSRAGYGEGVYRVFDLGTELKVIGKFRDYYVVEQEDANLLVNQSLLRLAADPIFERWDGYSRKGAEVFDNPYLRGDAIATLKVNTPLTVLESSGTWAWIEWEDGKGYVKADQLSKWRITGGGSSGGGGGGSSDGTDVSIGALSFEAAAPEPKAHLLGAYYGPETEQPFRETTATVIAEGTEGYICLLLRDDAVRVTSYNDETATLWLGDEQFTQIPRWMVRLETDEPYESWTGYSKRNGILYEEYQLVTELAKLSTNKNVTVLDELENCYVVEYEGLVGYMALDKVSRNRVSDGGGGSGGGGVTWTPPQM